MLDKIRGAVINAFGITDLRSALHKDRWLRAYGAELGLQTGEIGNASKLTCQDVGCSVRIHRRES